MVTSKRKDWIEIALAFILGLCGMVIPWNKMLPGMTQANINNIILVLFLLAYLIAARTILIDAVHKLMKGKILDDHLWISVATLLTFFLDHYAQSVAAILVYRIAEMVVSGRLENICADGTEKERSIAKKAADDIHEKEFQKVVLPVVVIGAALAIFITGNWNTWLCRAASGLVIATTWAITASVPLSFFQIVYKARKKNIQIQNAKIFHKLSKDAIIAIDADTMLSDMLQVQAVDIAKGNFMQPKQLLKMAFYGLSTIEHPVSDCICEQMQQMDPDGYAKIKEEAAHVEIHICGNEGVEAAIHQDRVYIGTKQFLVDKGIEVADDSENEITVYIGMAQMYLGKIETGYAMKEDAKILVQELHSIGMKKILLLSSYSEKQTVALTEYAGIKKHHAGMSDEKKLDWMKHCQSNQQVVIYVSNEQANSNVVENADLSICLGMQDSGDIFVGNADMSAIPDIFKLVGSQMQAEAKNLMLILGEKAVLLILAAFGWMPMWGAVLVDMLACLITFQDKIKEEE